MPRGVGAKGPQALPEYGAEKQARDALWDDILRFREELRRKHGNMDVAALVRRAREETTE